MPVQIERTTDVGDLYIAKPDLRYGVTFLSHKYRDYSVKGETMQDKMTGQIYTRRPSDGRVVSYDQHNRSVADLMLDLRIQMNNHDEFTYPEPETHEDAFLFVTEYDLTQIHEDKIIDALEMDFEIPNQVDDPTTQLKFQLSKDTNAFFLELDSRFTDRPFVSFCSSYYNRLIKNYSGDDDAYLEEQAKFDDESYWEDSDASVDYTVSLLASDGTEVIVIHDTANIRFNERSFVSLPYLLLENIQDEGEYDIKVTINKLRFDKLRFLKDHYDEMPESFKAKWEEIITPDAMVQVGYLSVMGFVDHEEDLALLGNDFLVTFMDVQYVFRLMYRLTSLKDPSYLILSAKRPGNDKWTPHTLWGEMVRHVYKDGQVIERNCEVNLSMMEKFFAPNQTTLSAPISQNSADHNYYFLNEQTYLIADLGTDLSNPNIFVIREV